MKKLPQNLTETNSLSNILRNVVVARSIIAATELGIFTALCTKRSPESLAKELCLHPPSVSVFLEMLRMMGLVVKKEDAYQNAPKAADLFLPDSFANVLPFLKAMRCGLLDGLSMLEETVRSGPSAMPTAGAEESNAAEAGACWAFRGVASALAMELEALPGAESFTRMLDLGGGHGVFSLYAVQALPGLLADIFDRPEPLAVARKYAHEWELSNRIRTIPGDYVRDRLDQGYDLVLASCTLNFTLPGEDTAKVIRKIYASLNPGGYFVGLHDALPRSGPSVGLRRVDEPAYPLECLAAELLSGVKMAIPNGFMAQTMLQSGFRHVHSREFTTPGGLFSLDIGQKAFSALS